GRGRTAGSGSAGGRSARTERSPYRRDAA
ncbi:hypothetical protein GA0115240_16721, partial [Streptomyces sp. DvalAA-14]